jgi:hypothetical protein
MCAALEDIRFSDDEHGVSWFLHELKEGKPNRLNVTHDDIVSWMGTSIDVALKKIDHLHTQALDEFEYERQRLTHQYRVEIYDIYSNFCDDIAEEIALAKNHIKMVERRVKYHKKYFPEVDVSTIEGVDTCNTEIASSKLPSLANFLIGKGCIIHRCEAAYESAMIRGCVTLETRLAHVAYAKSVYMAAKQKFWRNHCNYLEIGEHHQYLRTIVTKMHQDSSCEDVEFPPETPEGPVASDELDDIFAAVAASTTETETDELDDIFTAVAASTPVASTSVDKIFELTFDTAVIGVNQTGATPTETTQLLVDDDDSDDSDYGDEYIGDDDDSDDRDYDESVSLLRKRR